MTIMNDEAPDEKIAKLMIDEPSDFSFHAAYLAYSKAWAENPNEEDRRVLNEIMLSLAERQGSYSTFYSEIAKFRKNASPDYHRGVRFKAKKKRAWRKSQAKKLRISRHKK